MTLSLYSATIPQFLQILPGVLTVLDKTEVWARAQGLSDEEVLATAIAPDMWSFAKQARVAALYTVGSLDALETGVFRPDGTPVPTDFATLRAYIADRLAVVEAADPAAINAAAGNEVGFELNGKILMRFTAPDFLLTFALPNFHFHATAAYAIARGLGVPLGKNDYMAAPRTIQPA